MLGVWLFDSYSMKEIVDCGEKYCFVIKVVSVLFWLTLIVLILCVASYTRPEIYRYLNVEPIDADKFVKYLALPIVLSVIIVLFLFKQLKTKKQL